MVQCPVADVPINAMRRLFELNVFAPIATLQAFQPLLLKPSPNGHRPLVIAHTSLSAMFKFAVPFSAAYAASKAAFAALARGLRLEMSSTFGLDVIELRSGLVNSNFMAHLRDRSTASAVPPALPDGSIFAAAKDVIDPVLMGALGDHESSMDAAIWAKEVVSDIESGNVETIYRGGFAEGGKAMDIAPNETNDLVLGLTRMADVAKAVQGVAVESQA
jgi:1-acylglycerone phosphate reductase